MPKVSMKVNGKEVSAEVEARTLLSTFLRENLRLTGTHVGCDTSQCGASVTSIEGLAQGGELHPMQAAFKEHHGLQCGFCTPGMVMSAVDLLQHNPDPSEKEVRDWLEGNICRCTGYHNIVKAVLDAAAHMRGSQQAAE